MSCNKRVIGSDKEITILDWPPREGKTHSALRWIAENDSSFVSLVPNHDLAKHQIDILEKFESDLTVVHLEGKSRSCINEETQKCRDCQYFKKTYDYSNVDLRAITHSNSSTTTEVIDAEYVEGEFTNVCPYHFLKRVKSFADGVITVPQLFHEVDVRNTLLIDEEVTLNYFYPQSAMIARYQKRYGEKQTIFHPEEYELELQSLEDKIKSEDEASVLIQEAINNLQDFIEYTQSNPGQENLIDYLEDKEFTIHVENSLQESVFQAINENAVKCQVRNNSELRNLLLCTVFNHDFYVQQHHQNEFKVFLIGSDDILFFQDKFREFEKVILVGDKEAHKFASGISHESNIEISDVNRFKYRENFILLSIKGESLKEQKETILDIARELAKEKRSFLIFTSSKRKANQIRKDEDMSRRIITDGADRKEDISDFIESNLAVIAYLNSQLTRGVDVPTLDISLIHSGGFSKPKYEAFRESNDEDLSAKGEKLLDYTLSNELTNAVMRIAPIRGKSESHAKLVAIPNHYTTRLDYLSNPIKVSGEEALRVLRGVKKITSFDETGKISSQSNPNEEKSGLKSHYNKGGLEGVKNSIFRCIFPERFESFQKVKKKAIEILSKEDKMPSMSLRNVLRNELECTSDKAFMNRSLSILWKLGYFSKRREGRKVYWRLNDE